MAELKLRDVRKRYGTMEVLHGIDLDIPSGELVVFVGPSGCGKSTLLRSIAGLEEISSGEFRLDGRLMNHIQASQRGIAMVFQSYALYPHMTVFENMAFGLKIAGLRKAEIRSRIEMAADRLQLREYLNRYPKALSGGQRQRVAIGRAIVRNPKVFLFDEPLSNLDAALRVATRVEIAKLKQAMPQTTMIYVTHDQVEAMTLADRIVVLRDGEIEQVGSPIELYRAPANMFVARFIGSPAMNFLSATLSNFGPTSTFELFNGTKLTLNVEPTKEANGTGYHIGFRPEDLRLAEDGDVVLRGKVSLVEQLGEVQLVHVECRGLDRPIIAKLPGNEIISVGMNVGLTADIQRVHCFDQSERRLVADV